MLISEEQVNKILGEIDLFFSPKSIKAIIRIESNFDLLAWRYEPAFDRKNKDKWTKPPYSYYAYGEGSTTIGTWLDLHKRNAEIQPGDWNIPANLWLASSYGFMQILGVTALDLGFKEDEPQIYEPKINIKLGIKYLQYQLERYNGKINWAVAAYNAGSAHIIDRKFVNQDYVNKVMSLYLKGITSPL